MKPRHVTLTVGLACLAALPLCCMGGSDAGGAHNPATSPAASEDAPAAPPPATAPAVVGSESGPPPVGLDREEVSTIDAFRAASPSVVNITNIATVRDYWSMNVQEIPQGSGTGFVWENGYIVTNAHVVENATAVQVTLADQTTHDAEILGVAPNKDIAVLRLKGRENDARLKALPVGVSKGLVVGQKVLAIGNPFGLDHSLSVGVISALGREITSPGGRSIRDVVQTDAAINPGNSGGPLLDSQGRVIGMNSAIASRTGAFAGIGFAIPVDTIKRIVPQLIARGRPIEAGIGVSLVSDNLVERWGFDGAMVLEVFRNTPAERAGLHGVTVDRSRGRIRGPGDRIVAVNGKKIENGDDLYHAFDDIGVGGDARLTVVRGEQRREVPIKLVELQRE